MADVDSSGGLICAEASPQNRTQQGPPLRLYQQHDVDEIRRVFTIASRVLYAAPTGSGKTTVFSYIANSALRKGKRILILAHRDEIVQQISQALVETGAEHGVIAAGYPEGADRVQVASVATLVRRLDRIQSFDLIVIDECHHAIAGTWRKILEAMPEAFVLGVTATPTRLDGRGLGDIFERIVIGPSIAKLIRLGFLAPATVYAPHAQVDLSGVQTRAGDFAQDQLARVMNDLARIRDAVEHYAKRCPGVPAVAFCVDRKHSERTAERFRDQGFRAAHVDGETSRDERRRLIGALGSGDLDVLTNCGLIAEGVDVPMIGAAILMRPTKSLALHLQQIGRALRPAPGKTRALILDHAGNTLRHGLPDAPREWSLEGMPRARIAAAPAPKLRHCGCGALNRQGAPSCGACGEQLYPGRAELEEITEKLRREAAARGYRRGWIYHRLREIGAIPSQQARVA